VFEEPLSADQLLEMWRDATRAAELADRLAAVAADNLASADRKAFDAASVADLAEQASEAADRAAARAREVAITARRLAEDTRDAATESARGLTAAQADAGDKRGLEAVARDRYVAHEAADASPSGPIPDRGSRSVREPHER